MYCRSALKTRLKKKFCGKLCARVINNLQSVSELVTTTLLLLDCVINGLKWKD